MKKFFALMMVAVAMFCASNAFAAEVYDSISPYNLRKWMQAEGYTVEIDGDGDILWKFNGIKSYITFYKGNESIQYYCAFNSDSATLEKCNKFNLGWRYCSSLIPKAGSVRLEADLDLAGGVTKARILDFIKTCKLLNEKWRKEVVD